jgi:peptide/nickel transport system permease protein
MSLRPPTPYVAIGRPRQLLADFRSSWLPLFGLVVLLVLLVLAGTANLISPHDPNAVDIVNRLKPPFWIPGGSPEFPLGTDSVGRDVLSRTIYGSRVSLLVGFAAVVIGGPLGITLGLLSGYYGGWVDDLIMRIGDIQLAFPFILLAITIFVVIGANLLNVVLILGLTNWVTYGRVVRGEVMALRTKEFIEASRAIGVSDRHVLLRHLLPNTFSSIIVITSLAVPNTILSEASLSFLGLGVPPSTPTWGGMLAEGRDHIVQAWWLVAFPGIAIAATVLGINVLGDWLRDHLDPRLREV